MPRPSLLVQATMLTGQAVSIPWIVRSNFRVAFPAAALRVPEARYPANPRAIPHRWVVGRRAGGVGGLGGGDGDEGDHCELIGKGRLNEDQNRVLDLERRLGVVRTRASHGGRILRGIPPPPLHAGDTDTTAASMALSNHPNVCKDMRLLETRGSMAIQRPKPFPDAPPPSELVSPASRPTRIILIRHGESLGNVSEIVYTQQPDWKIPLSETGVEQSLVAGRKVKEIVGDSPIVLYHSPYSRAVQSAQLLLQALDSVQVLGVREEPRIAEQQFGNLQDLSSIWRSKLERRKYGRFFYRFPDGEAGFPPPCHPAVYPASSIAYRRGGHCNRLTPSFRANVLNDMAVAVLLVTGRLRCAGLDVYSRISSFIGTLRRDHVGPTHDIVIVTHGLALRLFLMRWFQWTVEQFESTYNPPNGGLAVMVRQADGRYELTQETLEMVGATRAPTTSIIGRAMLRRAYVDAFLSY